MEYEPPTLSADQSDLLAEAFQLGLEERDYGFWAVQIRDDARCDKASFIGFVGLSVPIWEATFTPCMELSLIHI